MRVPKIPDKFTLNKDSLYNNGKKVFTIPAAEHRISVVGFWGSGFEQRFVLGTRACCFGNFYDFRPETKYRPYRIMAVDTNVYDLLPVYTDYKRVKGGFPNEDGILTVGSGCSGSGVRLISAYYPRQVNILSEKEYDSQFPKDHHAAPLFRADSATGKIYVDFRKSGWFQKSGTTLNPAVPAILVNSKTHEFRFTNDLWTSLDITKRLENAGIDIRKTFEDTLRCSDEHGHFNRIYPP